MDSQKLAVILPGTGYTKDKPLLYYASTIAMKKGYEIINVGYDKFFEGVNYRNKDEMDAVTGKAYQYAAKRLDEIDFSQYETVVFIGKSFGTIVGTTYASEHNLDIKQVWYTPVMEAYEKAIGEIVAFMGDKDPIANVDDAHRKAKEKEIPLHVYPDANHSLATGDALIDIDTLKSVMTITNEFIE
ncbi:dienelactone hydrolase family protein [Butyrivibrio sp. VCB2006]|uniref:dienelactone hydrolase family protein n=1 Tax=Butyrivibrio sp. VCB2006 TaxID=1280679 RepID=UPI00041C65CC|nr:dienelactone hydrolase family protein [Butyrivibrio sp. VCB2006]